MVMSLSNLKQTMATNDELKGGETDGRTTCNW